MLIWVCDQCGVKVERHPIVGNEFGYLKHFESLAVAVDGKQDLCKSCMKKLTDVMFRLDLQVRESKWAAIKQVLGVGRSDGND